MMPFSGRSGLLLVLIVLGLVAVPVAEASLTLFGSVSNTDVFNNLPAGSGIQCTVTGTHAYFHAHPVAFLSGPVRVDMTLMGLPAARVFLHRGLYAPGTFPLCQNLVASRDFGLTLTFPLKGVVAPGPYTIFVTGMSDTTFGDYRLDVTNDVPPILTGPGPGGGPRIRGFSQFGGPAGVDYFAYPTSFTGGVSVASVGVFAAPPGEHGRKIVVGANGQVHLFNLDGSDFGIGFAPYPGFNGQVRVAACPSNRIITAPGPGGGPHVRVWNIDPVGKTASLATEFFAYPVTFTGGVFVACGTVMFPISDYIVTGADAGGGPHVRVWRLSSGPTEVFDYGGFFAFAAGFTGGVRVATGDVDNDAYQDIIVAAGPGGGPHVRVMKVQACGVPCSPVQPQEIAGFFPFPATFAGGVSVAAGYLGGFGDAQIITGTGPGVPAQIRAFDLTSGQPIELANVFPYDQTFTGGVAVGAGLRSTQSLP